MIFQKRKDPINPFRWVFSVVVFVSGLIAFLFILFKSNELLGPHPAPLAIAVAVAMTVGVTLLNGADIVGTVLKARRENIPLRKFRSTIIRKAAITLSLWIFVGPVFT